MNARLMGKSLSIFVVWAALLSAPGVWGQTGRGGEAGVGDRVVDPQTEESFTRIYDPSTVVTMTGTVTKVERTSPTRGAQTGIHVFLDTGRETVPVYLGPQSFLRAQQMRIEAGDEVTVTGSRVRLGAEEAIIAANLRAGENVVRLRDPSGRPAWAGLRMGRNSDPIVGSRGPMTGRPRPGTMQGETMTERRERMMERRERLMAGMEAMQARLERQVQRLDEALNPEEKMEAMEDVILELVRQRQAMFERIGSGQQAMTERRDPSEQGPADGTYGGRGPLAGAANRASIEIPPAMEREHRDLHAQMQEAVAVGGETAEAARVVQERLGAHFQEENEIAMPLLGLLPALAAGRVTEEMRPAIELGNELDARLADFLEEHQRIYEALNRLERAAEDEGKTEQADFARRLRLHAQNEEQVLYPAGILIGKYVEAQLNR